MIQQIKTKNTTLGTILKSNKNTTLWEQFQNLTKNTTLWEQFPKSNIKIVERCFNHPH